ncbi:transmembrane protein 70, mitochondrial-like [Sceloporus undulatus]|uniref:transmembrane protein 70, mitochondrial-like n=1 Tax=Sceloporus undulatus TaxID=8520 RepID=UPI001C4C0015|nr:transmembrane protein 70, mitochondrial-like [Sceloporus undulatus]
MAALLLVEAASLAPGFRPWLRGAAAGGARPLFLRPPWRPQLPPPPVAGRPASGWLPRRAGNSKARLRMEVMCRHMEALRCFSTSSHHENSEYGRLIYCGNLAKAVLGRYSKVRHIILF